MTRIALISAALGIGWITAVNAMETELQVVSEQRHVQVNSNAIPHLDIPTVHSSPRNLSLDIGLKNKAVSARRLGTHPIAAKKDGNEPKVYNPVIIPLW